MMIRINESIIVGAGRSLVLMNLINIEKTISHYGALKSKNFTVCGVYDTNINKSKLFQKIGIPFFKTLNDALNIKPKLICIIIPYNRNLDM